MARKSLSDFGVQALKPRIERYAHPDPALAGHYVRVQPSGAKSFCAVARSPAGKQIWTTIGATEVLSIAEARTRAREIIRRVRDGFPAVEPKAETFGAVVETWLQRHVDGNGLRSHKEIRRLLKSHLLPAWKDREFAAIRRSEVVELLDGIEDDHGARQADLVLAIVSKVMNWHATRADDYQPPLVKGMRRTNPKERERKRILDDVELRAVWKAAETSDGAAKPFGVLIRLLLLTAQRLAKVQTMRWSDITMVKMPTKKKKRVKGNAKELALWTIPTEAREKGNAEELLLPDLATKVIRAQPRFDGNPYVLAGRRNGHFNNLSNAKRHFDGKIAAELPNMPQWQLHDLRRTARSLMSRAGVLSEHAERVMGHALPTIEGTYNRHEFRDEKADALARLAALIDSIVHPRLAAVSSVERRRKEVTPL